MKFRTKVLFTVVLLSAVAFTSNGQDGLEELLESGVSDATKITGAYVAPGFKAIGNALAAGWYNTGAPHKLGGFDLTITGNLAYIPDDELFFDAAALDLETVRLVDPGDDLAPTIMGPDITPTYEILDQNGSPTGETFEGPPGLDLKGELGLRAIPLPMANLGIGLPKGTELKVRFIPTIGGDGDEVQFKFWGLAIMHDVKQHIPKMNLVPIDISFFGGYSKMKITTDLSGTFDSNGTDQTGAITMTSTTLQGLVSKKVSVLTFYGGLGYNIIKTALEMKGSYDIDGSTTIESYENNPLSIDISGSGPRFTVGMRLKLGILTFHGDYTLQKYNVLSAGLGFSFR